MDERVRLLEGWFSESLPNAPIGALALLRIDCDLYSSTMDSLINLYPKVVDGGFVIIDDYFSWPSCKKATDEYLKTTGEAVSLNMIDSDAVFWRVRRERSLKMQSQTE
jgi:demethyldecarbamoylnovobiocin O-methyltransferase/8-demethyl-8-(2,3-dimethoxy-alpha-L-rhamnosyl)tetracenomycin-C 4'-O-methyltransferase